MEKLINNETLNELHLPQPCQLGIMVDDVEKAAPAFLHFIGQEGFREYRMLNTEGAIFRGKPVNFIIKIAKLFWQELELELMQVIDSPFHAEYYEKHGQGLHHLGFRVPDVKAYYPVFESFGAPLICSSHWINKVNGPTCCAYFDTTEKLGFILELVGPYRE